MLRLFSDAFRHGGPVGGLVGAVLLVISGALFLPLIVGALLDFLPGALIPLTLVLLLVSLRRRRNRTKRPDSEPIHQWPKLGQNDRALIRSKLQQTTNRL